MSWNRTRYDECAYQKDLSQSTSPIYYTMDTTKYYNSRESVADFGIMAGNNVSVTTGNMGDLESDLYGITRQESRCPERKYLPHCQQCDDLSGVPCVGACQKTEQVSHLPAYKERIVQYAPRIDHVGYRIQYPVNPAMNVTYPPQYNPTHYVINS